MKNPTIITNPTNFKSKLQKKYWSKYKSYNKLESEYFINVSNE